MTDEKTLAADLKRAATASPANRIEHRDRLAAHGAAVVEPLLGWVREGKRAHFVIRVFERLATTDPAAALQALDAVATADRDLAGEAQSARRRLAETLNAGASVTGRARATGVLDQVTPFGPPAASGDCMGVTQQGEPCRNPGRYWVGDKLSCSRGHAEYR